MLLSYANHRQHAASLTVLAAMRIELVRIALRAGAEIRKRPDTDCMNLGPEDARQVDVRALSRPIHMSFVELLSHFLADFEATCSNGRSDRRIDAAASTSVFRLHGSDRGSQDT